MRKSLAVLFTALFSTSLLFAAQVVFETHIGKTWHRAADTTADELKMPASVTVDDVKLVEVNTDATTKKLRLAVTGQPFSGTYPMTTELRGGKLYGQAVLFSKSEGGGCSSASEGVVTLSVPLGMNSDGVVNGIGQDAQLSVTSSFTYDNCHSPWVTLELIK